MARELPASAHLILESRLGGGSGRVDLSLAVKSPPAARDLAGRPFSAPARALLHRWAEGEPPLAPASALWLELDLLPEEAGLPDPVLCARLPAHCDSLWLAGDLLPALHGGPLTPRQRAQVLRLADAVRPPASLLYAFSLRARGSEAVRLEVFLPEMDLLARLLERVAPSLVPAARPLLAAFAGAERLHLSLDLAEEVLPRCGIEGSFPRSPRREPRWHTLFNRLVEAGLCAPERREAALEWPGVDSWWTAAERWPLREAGLGSVCIRGLSHLKGICGPGREPEAKVYLTLGAFDRTPSESDSSRARLSDRST